MTKDLLLKYIKGEADSKEIKIVLDWIESSTANKNYFVELKNMWVLNTMPTDKRDIDANYLFIIRSIKHKVFVKRLKTISFSAAACILLLISLDLTLNSRDSIIDSIFNQTEQGLIAKSDLSDGRSSTSAANRESNNSSETDYNSDEKIILSEADKNIKNDDNAIKQQVTTESGAKIHTITIPSGYTYNVTLPDSSVVFLSPNSTLRYASEFSEKVREVQFSGEAYFQIRKSKTPFVVNVSNRINVTVYGTEFNINTNKKGKIETILVSGSVGVSDAHGSEVRLKPNQMLNYSIISGLSIVQEVNPADYLAWMKGDFKYDNQQLAILLDEISAYYDIKIDYNAVVANKIGSINLSRKLGYKQIMEILEAAMSVKFIELNKNTYICEMN